MTRSQYEVYIAIDNFIKKHGYSPSVRELCKITKKSSPGTIYIHLKKLKKDGYITYIENKSRTIRITKEYRCQYENNII